MTEHTPGPWRYDTPPDGWAIVHEIDPVTGDVEYICGETTDDTDPFPPRAADTRLIVAAPDLLRACEAIAACNVGHWGSVDWMDKVADAVDAAKVAIAKATEAAK